MNEQLFAEAMRLRRRPEFVPWGESPEPRFTGRAAEFGYADDYELTVALVDLALKHKAGRTTAAHIALARVTDAAGWSPISYVEGWELPNLLAMTPEFADRICQTLMAQAKRDCYSWDGLLLMFEASIVQDKLPPALGGWALRALKGEISRPSRRGPDPSREIRDGAILFAVRLGLETGALPATHSAYTRRAGPEVGKRALSVCQLVSLRASALGFQSLTPNAVAAIWRRRGAKA